MPVLAVTTLLQLDVVRPLVEAIRPSPPTHVRPKRESPPHQLTGHGPLLPVSEALTFTGLTNPATPYVRRDVAPRLTVPVSAPLPLARLAPTEPLTSYSAPLLTVSFFRGNFIFSDRWTEVDLDKSYATPD